MTLKNHSVTLKNGNSASAAQIFKNKFLKKETYSKVVARPATCCMCQSSRWWWWWWWWWRRVVVVVVVVVVLVVEGYSFNQCSKFELLSFTRVKLNDKNQFNF